MKPFSPDFSSLKISDVGVISTNFSVTVTLNIDLFAL